MRALRLPTHASPVTYLFRFRGPRDPSLLRARCCQRSRADGGSDRARTIVQPAVLFAGSLSRGREWDLSASQATHPVPLPRSKTPAEPTFPRQCRSRRCCPCRRQDKGFSIAHIGATAGLQHLLSTLQGRCCHRHMQDSLPAGWLAFAGRELNPLDRYERFPSCYISSPFPEFILTLDGSEHDGVLGAIGMTIRGELAIRALTLAPQTSIR